MRMLVGPGRVIRQQEYLWDYNFNNYRATGIFFGKFTMQTLRVGKRW